MKILWKRIDHEGLELCQFLVSRKEITLGGLVILNYEGRIFRIEYDVTCAPDWQTRSARIQSTEGNKVRRSEIEVDARKRWTVNGKPVVTVDGCVDIDLGFSPSTNLLPIRRLHLVKGVPVRTTAAWVEFPSFKLKPLKQVYKRSNTYTIHYESADGEFQRDLEVDSHGIVRKYPGIWELETIGW
jgi:uncharacterized protein